MEPLLINIANLFEKVSATQEGRESLMQMCSSIQMYVAGKALPTHVAIPVAAAPVAALPVAAPHVADAHVAIHVAAAPPVADAHVAIPVAAAPSNEVVMPRVFAEAVTASTGQKKFPEGYEIIADATNRIKHEMDAIDCITDVSKRVDAINKLYRYIIIDISGILLFNTLEKSIKMQIATYLNQLKTIYNNIPNCKFYRERFNNMLFFLNNHRAARFSWYEGDTRITVVHTSKKNFREIRRGELTGKKLTNPRIWADFHALKAFWSENGLTISNVATSSN